MMFLYRVWCNTQRACEGSACRQWNGSTIRNDQNDRARMWLVVGDEFLSMGKDITQLIYNLICV